MARRLAPTPETSPRVVEVPYTLELPPLYPYQQELVTNPARELVVISATGLGKTVGCAAWILAGGWEDAGSLSLWFAPTYKQAREGYQQLKEMAWSAGVLLPGRRGFSESDLIIRLDNAPRGKREGSRFEFRSFDIPQNLQGPHGSRGVIDEAGLLTPAAQAIISSRFSNTLGPRRYIGNPTGTGSTFWQLCQYAAEQKELNEKGEGDGWWDFLKWTWRDRYEWLPPEQAAAYKQFIDNARRVETAFEFQRLYEAEWAAPENAVFAPLLSSDEKPGFDVLDPDPNPHPGHPYFIGWDIGGTIDWTVGVPLCLKCWTVSDIKRIKPGDTADLEIPIAEYSKHWNNSTAVIETNGPGNAIFDRVVRRHKRVHRWHTDNNNKRAAIFEILRMASAAQPPTLTIAKIPALLNELRVFQSKQNPNTQAWTFAAPAGAHDDCVMGLVIAVGAATSGAASHLRALRGQLEAQQEREKKDKPKA